MHSNIVWEKTAVIHGSHSLLSLDTFHFSVEMFVQIVSWLRLATTEIV